MMFLEPFAPPVVAKSSWRRSTVVLMGVLVWVLAGCDGGSSMSAGREAPFLTGTITIPQGTRVDQDTALDILEEGTRNEALQSPPLPEDVVLAGFVSQDSGDYSPFFGYPQDPEDFFQLNMQPGQGVSLRFFNALGDGSEINVITRLVAPSGAVFQHSETSSTSRVLVAEEEGLHTLEIETPGGPPLRYLLSTTTTATDSSGTTLDGVDFVVGEAIVTLVEQPLGVVSSVLSRLTPSSQRSLGGMTQRWQMPAQSSGISDSRIGLLSSSAPAADRQATLEWIRELQQDPTIASASPNFVVRSVAEPTQQSAYTGLQEWHYAMVGLDADAANGGPWESGLSGAGIRVAVLDTGVFSPDQGMMSWHPELDANIDCVFPFNEDCFNATEPGTAPLDSGVFHGTHVAGTVAASVFQGGEIAGVAFNARLIPVKVLENLEGTIADVIEGVNWVVNEGGDPRADIINMSLGTSGDSPGLRQALERARQAGILVVAAAGNDASRRELFPAAYESVLSVGAVDCNEQLSGFSNFGFSLDLVAPGGGGGESCAENQRFVWSAGVDAGQPVTAGLQGTSMASPHVAGALALLLEAQSEPVSRERWPAIIAALNREQRLHDVTDEPFSERRGRGLLDTRRLLALGDRINDLTVLVPDQRQIVFPNEVNAQTLELSVAGNTQENVTGVEVHGVQDWLEVDDLGDNRFRIRLIRNDLPTEGARRGNLEVSYRSNGEPRGFTLPVSVLVPADESQRNAGTHFVLLIPVDGNGEPNDEEAIETVVEAVEGRYHFRFDPREIPPGDYLLVAGSDIDNNGRLCEEGEACSEFPVTGGAEPITITPETRRHVTMSTRYLLPVSTQSGEPLTPSRPR